MNAPLVYVFKKSNEFELSQSVRLARKNHPKHPIWLIGDKPKSVEVDKYIPHNQNYQDCRATRITRMLLEVTELTPEFILMYDDIFLNDTYDFKKLHHKAELYIRKSSNGFQKCISNTCEALLYFYKPIKNYECHQPQLINSSKLKEVLSILNWEKNDHVIKSLYFNYFDLGYEDIRSENLKVRGSFKKTAQKFWDTYGCFSTSECLTHQDKVFIESL